jgi:hypothetical protein
VKPSCWVVPILLCTLLTCAARAQTKATLEEIRVSEARWGLIGDCNEESSRLSNYMLGHESKTGEGFTRLETLQFEQDANAICDDIDRSAFKAHTMREVQAARVRMKERFVDAANALRDKIANEAAPR